MWEDIKAGSKQASEATKEALDSVNNPSEENTSEIKTSAIEPVKQTNGSTSTPTPLKASEKVAQPPEIKGKGSYAVHLSSNKSKKSAEQEWVELKNAFPKETQGLQLQLKPVNITGKGTFFRVLGSSYKTKASANKACKIFKQKKQYCMAIKL
ncbi:MAG: SPOR domain-containing protein [Halopseudomonas aestusnigri]